jgi:hypothetical protein
VKGALAVHVRHARAHMLQDCNDGTPTLREVVRAEEALVYGVPQAAAVAELLHMTRIISMSSSTPMLPS